MMSDKNVSSSSSSPSPDDNQKESSAVSDTFAPPADYSVFIWQKLNSLDDRLAGLCENFGRVETKLDAVHDRVEKLESKVSRLERTILIVGGILTGGGAIIAIGWAVYKVIAPHLQVTLR